MLVAAVLQSTTQMRRRPWYRQAWASPMPMFPELDSTMTVSGPITPERSPSSRMATAGRSLMLPPGLKPSSLAKTRKSAPA